MGRGDESDRLMIMKLRSQSIGYVGTSILIIGAIGLGLMWLSDADREARSVRIGFINIAASLPLFIADENGFFLDEGLTVETYSIANSNQLVDGILADNLDLFVESSAVPVLAADIRSPGAMKIFAVSSITSENPFDAILVRADASIESLEDLEGTSIGVFPGSTATNLLKKFLEDIGVDVGRIAFLPIPPQSQLAALQEGSIAALHAYEPTTAIALSNGDIRKLYGSVYAEMLEPNPQGIAVVSTEFARRSPDLAASTIRALERAMTFMRENDAESRKILSSRLGLPEAAADTMIFLYMVGHDDISAAALQGYADMLTELGELPEDIDVSELIYMDDD